MKHIILSLLSTLILSTALAAEKDARCWELRTYYAAPGKLDELNDRFRTHTLKLFEKHGMQNVGYWVPVDNSVNKLIYLVTHKSRESAQESWKAFFADPAWKEVVKTSEANGRLVARMESIFLTPTDYSPAIEPALSPTPRLFELRTYQAAPGKLADLNARFRQHTRALFARHGMTQFGYGTPMDKDQGAEDTLIYILAHSNRVAADAAWKDFRADPVWVAAKKASEVNGSLTIKVESLLMNPTDYSPTK